MDTIEKIGELALGSRLKRLSDRMLSDVNRIYDYHQIDFKATWFPIVQLLNEIYPDMIGITEIARELKVSHPFVNKISSELKKAGLILELNDKADKRKRIIMLNDKGHQLLKKLEPIWNDLQLTIREILIRQNNDLFAQIKRFEESLNSEGLYDSYYQRIRDKQLAEIKIHVNNPDHFRYFKSLNIEWLEAYFRVEEKDDFLLNNPNEIIDKGGYIFTAEYQGEILGTCCLIRYKPGSFELGKMGVTENARGLQIGKKLGQFVIEHAKKLSARELVLETNNSLKPALNLYKQLGFTFLKESPFGQPSVERADVFMKYNLK